MKRANGGMLSRHSFNCSPLSACSWYLMFRPSLRKLTQQYWHELHVPRWAWSQQWPVADCHKVPILDKVVSWFICPIWNTWRCFSNCVASIRREYFLCVFFGVHIWFLFFIQYIDIVLFIFASNFLILYLHMINISICVFLGSNNADGNFVEAVALKKCIVWVGNGPCVLHLLRKAGVRMRACFLAG